MGMREMEVQKSLSEHDIMTSQIFPWGVPQVPSYNPNFGPPNPLGDSLHCFIARVHPQTCKLTCILQACILFRNGLLLCCGMFEGLTVWVCVCLCGMVGGSRVQSAGSVIKHAVSRQAHLNLVNVIIKKERWKINAKQRIE